MIVRIVTMHFREEGVPVFLGIFTANQNAIRNFPGCRHLELLRDVNHPNIFTTLSHWDSTADLDAYRKSELFEGVWTRVKKLFAARAEARTLISDF